MPYIASIAFVLIVWIAVVILNERHNLLSCDRFPNATLKWLAYIWLGLFMITLAALVTGSALTPPTSKQLASVPFYSLFMLHVVLVGFLAGWWALSGRPSLKEFLQIRHERPAEVVAIGTAVGVGGWMLTLLMAMLVALALQAAGFLEEPPDPPAMIGWMAALPVWKKAMI